ncbi:hypothetical protein ACGFNY_04920 [Streptomyces chartreusis]|uniref:hypothetical protein n=1 Tax=Streptomyces chartreusis TaxID=1969 RepID=UPI00371FA89C
MTTATETIAEEYERLASEQAELSAAARKTGDLPTEGKQRFREIAQRLREIATIPPAGYELPKLAADLVAHAEAHGWTSLVEWTSPDYEGEPFVTVQVGRKLRDGEMPDARGDKWIYKATWHSRDCAPGKVRLFRGTSAVTPDRPVYGDGPSIKAIRAVIEQHPAA